MGSSFPKKTIRDIDLIDKTVLLRADYNVPIDENGKITGDYRITQSLPTLQYLLDKKCKIVICSHLGRPEGKQSKYSLKPVAEELARLLKINVALAKDCIGPDVTKAAKNLKPGEILLLENLRFYKEEEKNDSNFAKQLAALADVFVQDGFGVVHRAHSSTDAITKYLPSVAGLLLEKEVSTINEVMENPKRPLVAIVGGAKISDKIGVLNRFIDIADFLVVGGAMANTFLLANGVEIGGSKSDRDDIDLAKDIMARAHRKSRNKQFIFYLPQDGVVAKTTEPNAKTRIVDWDSHLIATLENYPKKVPVASTKIADNEKILDIGPVSAAFIAGGIQLAATVVWNGTMGVTETDALNDPIGPFAHGTELLIEAMLGDFGHKPITLVGGGDTVGYLEERNLTDHFDHVSTGGGASMDLMAGKDLPGVSALMDKDKK